MAPHVLFGTSAWGLGHATRDLVLIQALLEAGCEVSLVATGPALRVLRGELGDHCRYLDWPDMPTTIERSTLRFIARTTVNIPRILHAWYEERRRLRALLKSESVDAIVSDHRYGLITDRLPSYFITHSPRYIAPWRQWFMEWMMERFVARWLRPARKVLVPDTETLQLSGEMSHNTRFLPREKMVFLGMLSSIRRRDVEPDVDLFITLSGPEPQRSMLQQKVLEQVPGLEGRIVIALGLPDQTPPPAPKGLELHAYLDRDQQERMLNRARMIVCRSGYTTLMELAELGKPALLIPTPAQTEQEYLAEQLRRRGLFHSVEQDRLDLVRDVPIARRYPGVRTDAPRETAARRFIETVLA